MIFSIICVQTSTYSAADRPGTFARLVRLDEHEQTPHPTPELTTRLAPRTAVDVAVYVAAVALAGAAAWFSIRGMVVIFPGSPVPVVIMAISMETAKLVTAGWLARRWSATAVVWRAALVVLQAQ